MISSATITELKNELFGIQLRISECLDENGFYVTSENINKLVETAKNFRECITYLERMNELWNAEK